MTFLPRSMVRSSTWSPPAQPTAIPSAGSAPAVPADQVLLGLFQDVVAERQRGPSRRPDTA